MWRTATINSRCHHPPPPIHPTDPEDPAHGRFIGLHLHVWSNNNSKGALRKKRKRNKSEKIPLFITSAYSPVKRKEQEPFNAYLNSVYTTIDPDTRLFQGQDVNAALGIHQDDDDYNDVLGRYGLAKRDKRGIDTIGLL